MNPSSLEVQYLHEQLAVIYPRSLGFLPDEEHRMPTDERVWRQRDFFNNIAGMTLEERERLHREMMENVFLSPLYVPPKARGSEKLLSEPVEDQLVATNAATEKLLARGGIADKSKLFSDRPRFGGAANVMGKKRIPSTPKPESSIGLDILKIGLAEVGGFLLTRVLGGNYEPGVFSQAFFRDPKPKET